GALRPPPDPEEPSSGHEAEGVDGARDIVLCHRMRFPAVQGFEGPRGIVAITVPRAGSLTAALSARPPVLSPSWPPGITASAIELRPHGSARRPDRPCERGGRSGGGARGAVKQAGADVITEDAARDAPGSPAGTTRFPRAGRCGAHPMGRWGSVLSVVDGGRLLIDREQRGCGGMAIKRQVLRAEVEELILERLLESRWSPGSRLSIDGLARDLEVSPTPVREAMVSLERSGLVEYVALRGYVVAPMLDVEQMTELLDARKVV